MENFEKIAYKYESGIVVVEKSLIPHSIVILADKGVAYNIAAKVRRYDKVSIAKALGKAMLASMRSVYLMNNNEDAEQSRNFARDKVRPALGGFAILVTDKSGAIIQDSKLSIRTKAGDVTSKLRDAFKFTKSMALYEFVVELGLEWNDDRVVTQMKHWASQAVRLMDFIPTLDEALGNAADSNEREQDAEDAKERKENQKYYDIFGLKYGASMDELKKAYKKAVTENHPDKGGDTAKMQAINEAYEILSKAMAA